MVNRNLLRQYDGLNDELQQELDARLRLGRRRLAPCRRPGFPRSEARQRPRPPRHRRGRLGRRRLQERRVRSKPASGSTRTTARWSSRSPATPCRCCWKPIQDETGTVVLSYRKAKRQQEWDRIIQQYKDGDTVTGVVTRKIKGGLLVNIGVHVFLPASQVDIRRPADIGQFIGKTIECKILVIDEGRRNIVVSRRQLIEDQRVALREKLLAELEPGQTPQGHRQEHRRLRRLRRPGRH